jgi:SAM-dependent methyltransferase
VTGRPDTDAGTANVATAPESRCPVCGADRSMPFAAARDIEYRTSDAVYDYLQCGACDTVFLKNPPADRLHEIYPKNYYSYQVGGQTGLLQGIKRHVDARVFRKLLADIPGGELAVLDVGGGWGWLLSLLRSISPRVRETHEVDIDEEARARAESEGHAFHCVRIEDFESARQFDLILLLNLIEHVEDPRSVLTAVRGMLSPRGRVLIKTPNTDTWDRRLFQHRNWGGFHCPRHFVLFTKGSLTRLAGDCGLDVVSATYTQGGPQWAPSILGWLADRGWATVTSQRPMYQHPLYGPLQALGAALDYLRMPFAPTAQMFVALKGSVGQSES